MKTLLKKNYQRIIGKHRIRVTAELVHLEGNPKPHFAITGETHNRTNNGRWVWDAFGAIHDEIVRYSPHLQPLVDIHLADEDGVPSHAYGNASYWAGETEWQLLDLAMLAKHLRVTETVAMEMVFQASEITGTMSRNDVWQDVCARVGLPAIWKAQAMTAKLNVESRRSASERARDVTVIRFIRRVGVLSTWRGTMGCRGSCVLPCTPSLSAESVALLTHALS